MALGEPRQSDLLSALAEARVLAAAPELSQPGTGPLRSWSSANHWYASASVRFTPGRWVGHGFILTLFVGIFFFGRFIASIGGDFGQTTGARSVFWCCAGLAVLGMLLWLRMLWKEILGTAWESLTIFPLGAANATLEMRVTSPGHHRTLVVYLLNVQCVSASGGKLWVTWFTGGEEPYRTIVLFSGWPEDQLSVVEGEMTSILEDLAANHPGAKAPRWKRAKVRQKVGSNSIS